MQRIHCDPVGPLAIFHQNGNNKVIQGKDFLQKQGRGNFLIEKGVNAIGDMRLHPLGIGGRA